MPKMSVQQGLEAWIRKDVQSTLESGVSAVVTSVTIRGNTATARGYLGGPRRGASFVITIDDISAQRAQLTERYGYEE